MEDFDLIIETRKDKSPDKIEHFIDEMAKKYERNKYLVGELRSLLKEGDVQIKEKPRRFLNMILLSCILADIGNQMSPFVRNRNISKIRSICKKRGLNYKELVDITPYSDKIIEMINSRAVNCRARQEL